MVVEEFLLTVVASHAVLLLEQEQHEQEGLEQGQRERILRQRTR